MMEKLEKLVKQAKRAADEIRMRRGEIRVLSHYDADGIASAAIMLRALMRSGRKFHMTVIKQLGEAHIMSLAEEKRSIVVFLDMGSGQIKLIKKHLPDADVVIIDHHQQEGSLERSRILQVNPMDFGIEEDISGSGVTYLVARAMNPENRDLSGLAIVGAIGDSQIGSIGEEWGLQGLNKEIVKDGAEAKKVKLSRGLRLWGRYTRPVHKALEYSVDPYIPNVSGSESSAVQFLHELRIPLKKDNGEWRTLKDLTEHEQQRLASGMIAERTNGGHPNAEWIFGDVYELLDKSGECRDANEFATILNACGKMGRGFLGIELCLNVPKAFLEVRWVLEKYRRSIGDAVRWSYAQMEKQNGKTFRKTENAWYLLAGSRISEHIISNVISVIEKSLSPEKPVFAFADAEDGVKVSARADRKLVALGVNLKKIVSEAAEMAGGQGGGHSGAAGATIPSGSAESFITIVEEITAHQAVTNKNTGSDKNIKPHSNPIKSEEGNENGTTAEEEQEADGEEVEGQGLVQHIRP